jgi:hypothetical protein
MKGSVYKNKSGVLRTVGSSVQSKGTMLLVVTVASFIVLEGVSIREH